MGRHTAGDDAVVHPLVAQALQRRQTEGGTHRTGTPTVAAEQPSTAVGWPDEPRRGEGLGWPVDPAEQDDARPGPDNGSGSGSDTGRDPDDDGSVIDALDAAEETPPARPRRPAVARPGAACSAADTPHQLRHHRRLTPPPSR